MHQIAKPVLEVPVLFVCGAEAVSGCEVERRAAKFEQELEESRMLKLKLSELDTVFFQNWMLRGSSFSDWLE